jgi:hypothetical protein
MRILALFNGLQNPFKTEFLVSRVGVTVKTGV